MADDAGSKTPFDKEQRIRGMEKRQTLLRWEDPIEHRARALVLLARDKAAENTNKSELLAALVLAASEDPAELSRILREYRLSKVADAEVCGGRIVSLAERRPGPIPGTR